MTPRVKNRIEDEGKTKQEQRLWSRTRQTTTMRVLDDNDEERGEVGFKQETRDIETACCDWRAI